jgi:small subunit ribosomal protein S17
MPRRVLEGKVVSNKCQKTVTVLVERRVRDPLYGKIIRQSAKYAAHDETEQWNVGDQVSIEECRPLSKTKKWKVIGGKVLGESQAVTVDETDQKRVSVKRDLASQVAEKQAQRHDTHKTEHKSEHKPAHKAEHKSEHKTEAKADSKAKPSKKPKKDE